jgi:F-type H+-transporting ATPase subunit delta
MNNQDVQAEQYAQAIVQAVVERWQTILNEAADKLATDAELATLVRSSETSFDDKVQALENTLSVELSPVEDNLLKMLVQAGDTNMLPEIASALTEIASGRRAPLRADITSAIELTEEEKNGIRRKLTGEYGEGIMFTFDVDSSLLGGLRIRIGDRLIDSSVASRLSSLRESLTAAVR